MKLSGWKLVCGIFILTGCSHFGNNTDDNSIPDYLLIPSAKQITTIGKNDHPRFSFDNSRLLYTSGSRNSHKGQQVYEIDLLTNKERRVIFSDGDAFDAAYINENEIIYASTTDEIKENPLFPKPTAKENLPSEIYMSGLYGNEIVRLTQQPGYDGEPLFLTHPSKPFILFTSARGDVTGVYRLDLKFLPVSLISAEGNIEKRFPTATPDQKLVAWKEKNLKTNEQKIILHNLGQKSNSVIKESKGDYRDLFFAPRPPHRLFYSVRPKGEKYYQIESYDLDKNCTQVVLKGQDSLITPALSNEAQERLAFAREVKAKKQIWVINLPSDLGPCLETSN